MRKVLIFFLMLTAFSARADMCCTSGNESACCAAGGKKYCTDEGTGTCRTKCLSEIASSVAAACGVNATPMVVVKNNQ